MTSQEAETQREALLRLDDAARAALLRTQEVEPQKRRSSCAARHRQARRRLLALAAAPNWGRRLVVLPRLYGHRADERWRRREETGQGRGDHEALRRRCCRTLSGGDVRSRAGAAAARRLRAAGAGVDSGVDAAWQQLKEHECEPHATCQIRSPEQRVVAATSRSFQRRASDARAVSLRLLPVRERAWCCAPPSACLCWRAWPRRLSAFG